MDQIEVVPFDCHAADIALPWSELFTKRRSSITLSLGWAESNIG